MAMHTAIWNDTLPAAPRLPQTPTRPVLLEYALQHPTPLLSGAVSIEFLLTVIFVLVDDWYQSEGRPYLQGKVGVKPTFSDSELLTLLLAMDFIPFPSERQFWAYIRANHLALFPQLVSRTQFNRRARGLSRLVEILRRHGLTVLGATAERQLLLDTKPVSVLGYKRDKRHSDFQGLAASGVCTARNLQYYGFKLVMLTTLDGLPLLYALVAANCDERVAADEVLAQAWGCEVFADKGFIGECWQQEHYDTHGNRIWTAKRVNQTEQNPPEFDRLLNAVRERIEGVFNEVQNTGRNLERLLAKTVWGLATRVNIKLASHTLKAVLRRAFALDVQSFANLPD